MASILFYDSNGGFGPTYNREHAVGGAEIHLVQIAEYLANRGHAVSANVHQDNIGRLEGGVGYSCYHRWPLGESTTTVTAYDTVIIVGCAKFPEAVKAKRYFAFQVVDPRPCAGAFAHLRGRTTMVCVSEWQAGLFRQLGHEAVVIPVPVPDEMYSPDMSRKITHDFGCFSSWNKGALQTIQSWHYEWGTLAVGSAYSHPEEPLMPRNVTWLGTLRPREKWLDAMLSVGAIARICTIAETFGVVDTFARAIGIPCYTLCTGGVGSLREVGAQPFTDAAEWREAIRQRRPHPVGSRAVDEFRASRVLPQWHALVGG